MRTQIHNDKFYFQAPFWAVDLVTRLSSQAPTSVVFLLPAEMDTSANELAGGGPAARSSADAGSKLAHNYLHGE